MNSHVIDQWLKKPSQCYIGGCGQAFTAVIVSPEFTGLRVLARNRKVNSALKDEIAAMHAWSAKCKTPEEWDKEQATVAGEM